MASKSVLGWLSVCALILWDGFHEAQGLPLNQNISSLPSASWDLSADLTRLKNKVDDLNNLIRMEQTFDQEFDLPSVGVKVGVRYIDPNQPSKGGEIHITVDDLSKIINLEDIKKAKIILHIYRLEGNQAPKITIYYQLENENLETGCINVERILGESRIVTKLSHQPSTNPAKKLIPQFDMSVEEVFDGMNHLVVAGTISEKPLVIQLDQTGPTSLDMSITADGTTFKGVAKFEITDMKSVLAVTLANGPTNSYKMEIGADFGWDADNLYYVSVDHSGREVVKAEFSNSLFDGLHSQDIFQQEGNLTLMVQYFGDEYKFDIDRGCNSFYIGLLWRDFEYSLSTEWEYVEIDFFNLHTTVIFGDKVGVVNVTLKYVEESLSYELEISSYVDGDEILMLKLISGHSETILSLDLLGYPPFRLNNTYQMLNQKNLVSITAFQQTYTMTTNIVHSALPNDDKMVFIDLYSEETGLYKIKFGLQDSGDVLIFSPDEQIFLRLDYNFRMNHKVMNYVSEKLGNGRITYHAKENDRIVMEFIPEHGPDFRYEIKGGGTNNLEATVMKAGKLYVRWVEFRRIATQGSTYELAYRKEYELDTNSRLHEFRCKYLLHCMASFVEKLSVMGSKMDPYPFTLNYYLEVNNSTELELRINAEDNPWKIYYASPPLHKYQVEIDNYLPVVLINMVKGYAGYHDE